MIRLIQLELKKCQIKKYIKGAIISNIIILGILLLITYPIKNFNEDIISNYNIIFGMIDSLVRAIFIIFSGVLTSKIIIKEFKNKDIELLFSYPIDGKKLIIAKIFIIVTFAFLCIILSNIFLEISFYFLDKSLDLIPNKLNISIVVNNSLRIFIYALTSSIMTLIPLYLGLIKKSTLVTILTSIILVSIVCSYNNGFSLNSIIEIPISLAILGIVAAYLSIKKIDN